MSDSGSESESEPVVVTWVQAESETEYEYEYESESVVVEYESESVVVESESESVVVESESESVVVEYETKSVVVTWARRAWDYFWNNGGTEEEQSLQEQIVKTFGQTSVPGATDAEIIAPGHSGGTDPDEPWHITTRYYDAERRQISSSYGGAWHVYE